MISPSVAASTAAFSVEYGVLPFTATTLESLEICSALPFALNAYCVLSRINLSRLTGTPSAKETMFLLVQSPSSASRTNAANASPVSFPLTSMGADVLLVEIWNETLLDVSMDASSERYKSGSETCAVEYTYTPSPWLCATVVKVLSVYAPLPVIVPPVIVSVLRFSLLPLVYTASPPPYSARLPVTVPPLNVAESVVR